jgi:hypothetical protein
LAPIASASEYRNGRENRVAAQNAQTVTKVLLQSLHPRKTPCLACDFLDKADVAELSPRRVFRLFARFAPVHTVADRHLEMSMNFFVKVCVPLLPLPEWKHHGSPPNLLAGSR